MKVLERAKTPDGIDIQIEDWKKSYSCVNVLNIAAYPIAKNTSHWGWIRAGEKFRLQIDRFKNDKEVKQAFNDLINGTKQLTDFADQYYHNDKDKYYMGLINDYCEH